MKMTRIRREQLRYRLQESRSRLMERYPFFAILLMYFKFVAVDNIRNMSTNGRCIFFNASFVSKLTPKELDFILCHQIMHIINGDIWRHKSYAGDDYHRACDIINNSELGKLGWPLDRFSHFGKLQYEVPMYKIDPMELSPMDVYELLPYKLSILDEKTRNRYMMDSDLYWGCNKGDLKDGVLVLDVPDMTKYADGLIFIEEELELDGEDLITDEEALKMFLETLVAKIALMDTLAEKEKGDLPGAVVRELEKSNKKTVDWREILDQFVQEEITDYSFAPPDRRYMEGDFFLPDFNEKDYVAKDILFMADTSGSVNVEEVSRVYNEIVGAIEQFNGKLSGKLGFFDTEVYEPIDFENIEDIKAIIPYGGGGTSFHVVFDYVREHLNEIQPSILVIFTDGEADFPEQEMAMNIPVLWLISNEDITPPWGKVGRVVG